MAITIVEAHRALVNVGASYTRALKAQEAVAGKGANIVQANRIDIAIMQPRGTLIDVIANNTGAGPSGHARALKRAKRV